MNVLFRCDGSFEIGMGHVVRCMALADEFQTQHQCTVHFAMRGSALGIEKVRSVFPVITPEEPSGAFVYEYWLNDCIRRTKANVLILDARDGLPRTALGNIKRSSNAMVVTIDDPEDKRLEVDLAFYPPVPQVQHMDWSGFQGELFTGWEWVILKKQFSLAPPMATSKKNASVTTASSKSPLILISMGSTDPAGMTLKVIQALELLEDKFESVVVIGQGFQHKRELHHLLSNSNHCLDLRENVSNMSEIMLQSDLAVTSFGVTAYELAATGVPCIYLCLTEDHAESASAFVEAGMAVSLGVFQSVNTVTLSKEIRNMLLDQSRRFKLADNAKKFIDGHGANRISRVMVERFKTLYE